MISHGEWCRAAGQAISARREKGWQGTIGGTVEGDDDEFEQAETTHVNARGDDLGRLLSDPGLMAREAGRLMVERGYLTLADAREVLVAELSGRPHVEPPRRPEASTEHAPRQLRGLRALLAKLTGGRA